MNSWGEVILAALLLIDLWLAAASRLLHCIKLAAYHGFLIGILPLAMWNWQHGVPHVELLLISVIGVAVKGWLLPQLLRRAMDRAKVRRELEPLVGYSLSLAIVLALGTLAFWFCARYGSVVAGIPVLAAPVAFTTMLTGLFIIIARKKALTQAIGFLIFENGITVFGLGMTVEYGLLVELGILLDVLVLVFVMGIAVFQISREFSHIDADRLNELTDAVNAGREQENEGARA